MASRSRTTFKKRQKELARMEKQRDKAAKRMQRKTMKQAGGLPGMDGDPLDAVELEGSEPEGAETEAPETEAAGAADAESMHR
jgi:hypothetical protein